MTIVLTAAPCLAIAAGVALATGAPRRSPSRRSRPEYAIKPLPFDPAKINGLSEKLLVSHYENNYSAR